MALKKPQHYGPRLFLRVFGPVLLLSGLVLTGIAFLSFFSMFGSGSLTGIPKTFFLVFLGFPLVFVGGAMTKFGFLRELSGYAAEETSGAVTTTVQAARVGWEAGSVPHTEQATSMRCPACETSNDHDAKFCDSCGAELLSSV